MPQALSLSPCSCVLQTIPVTDCADICCRGLSPVYELYGVVVHCASNGKTLESGHYVNFIRCVMPAAGYQALDQMLLNGR